MLQRNQPTLRNPAGVIGFLAFLGLLLSGCESKSSETGAKSPGTKFVPPRLSEADLKGVSMPLDMKLNSARVEAEQAPNDVGKVGTLGALYLAHGFTTQAVVCLQHATELKPEDAGWRYALALAQEKAGRQEEAVATLEKLLAGQKDYPPTWLRLANQLVEKDPARAALLYQQVVAADPMVASAWYGLGRAAAAQGRSDEALANYRKALGVYPAYADAHRALADALQATGQTQEAEWHRRRVELGGAPPEIDDPVKLKLWRAGLEAKTLCDDALVLAQQGDFEQAESLLKQAADYGAPPAQLAQTAGVIRAVQRRWDDAAAEFRKALTADPNSLSAQLGLAQVMADSGNADEAERIYRQALARNPSEQAVLERLGTLMVRRGQPEEAVRLVEQALESDVGNADLHFRLAQFLAALNRTNEALAHLRRALELRPQFTAARHALAQGLHLTGDIVGARSQWQEAVRIDPKFEAGYLMLAALATSEKNGTEAKRLFREGLQRLPESHALANGLAWVLATAADPDERNGQEAVKLAEMACALTRNLYHPNLDTLAAAYAEVGRFADAVRVEKQAIELAAKTKDAQLVEQYRARHSLYMQHQPYREP